MIATFEEALAFVGIDQGLDTIDEVVTANLNRAMRTAESYLRGSVGKDVETYLPADPRVKELFLNYTDDFYSNRGTESAKVNNAKRRQIEDVAWQLRLELKSAKEAAGV